MAKAHSVRLDSSLMQAAATVGAQYRRSTVEQIEYWASLGRQIANTVDPDILLEISAGLASLSVNPIKPVPIDPATVFASIDNDRELGRLPGKVTESPVRYQVAIGHPGMLEQIAEDGTRTVGQFADGQFTPANV